MEIATTALLRKHSEVATTAYIMPDYPNCRDDGGSVVQREEMARSALRIDPKPHPAVRYSQQALASANQPATIRPRFATR